MRDIALGTAVAVSDGSFLKKGMVGTALWIIEIQDRSQYI